MEDKLQHVRKSVNPALWDETFQDDEDFYEAGYQPGEEVQLFAADEAGQVAKARLARLELSAAKRHQRATFWFHTSDCPSSRTV